MIKINRKSGLADRFRAYKILLDGDVCGEIRNGQEVEIDIHDGHHRLYLQIDWGLSNTVNFEYDGSLVTFECGSNYNGLRLLRAVVYILFPRGDYLWLKQT